MHGLFPEDPMLKLFSHRYASETFDPTAIRPLVSPTQSKLKGAAVAESFTSVPASPSAQYMEAVSSPKRPFLDDGDDGLMPPRKLARGESPLKGAAGRRLDQQRRLQHVNGGTPGHGHLTPQAMIPPLPRDITMLLSLIPNAKYYNPAERFVPEKIMELVRNADIEGKIRSVRAQGQVLPVEVLPQQTGGRFEPARPAYPVPQNLFGPGQSQPGPSWNYR